MTSHSNPQFVIPAKAGIHGLIDIKKNFHIKKEPSLARLVQKALFFLDPRLCGDDGRECGDEGRFTQKTT